jgi:hypothetical protein
MQRSYNKDNNFTNEIVLLCRKEDLIFYEQLLIDNLNPQLNLSKLAGKVDMTPERVKKISEKQKGKIIPEEVIIKLRKASLIQFSKEGSKEAIIESNKRRKGEKQSESAKEKKRIKMLASWKKKKEEGYKRGKDSEETKIKKREAAYIGWEKRRKNKGKEI